MATFRFFYLKICLKIIFQKGRFSSGVALCFGPDFVLLTRALNAYRIQFGWQPERKFVLLQLPCHLGYIEMNSACSRCNFQSRSMTLCFSTVVSLLWSWTFRLCEVVISPFCKSLKERLPDFQSEMEFKQWLKIRYRYMLRVSNIFLWEKFAIFQIWSSLWSQVWHTIFVTWDISCL